MKNKALLITGVIFILTLIFLLAYFFSIREMVLLSYYGKAPDWFMSLITEFYPRFFVEKHRFQPDFFIKKADQVILRFSFISIITCLALLLKQYSKRFKDGITHYFNQYTSPFNVTAIRILYFISIIILFYDIYWILTDLAWMKTFYKPLPLLKLLHIQFPSHGIIALVCVVLYLSCILGILNILPVLNSIIVILLFIYIQGLIFSFEKMDHGFAPITYAGMIMPFLLLQSPKKSNEVPGWPLQLIQLLICLCYFFAGIEKLFIAGLDWIHPETFRTYLLIHHTKIGMRVASNNLLCTILPTAALLFQLGFISILFNKNLIPFFLIAGILFHLFTYFLFDVGGILHPWILSYFYFINWKKASGSLHFLPNNKNNN